MIYVISDVSEKDGCGSEWTAEGYKEFTITGVSDDTELRHCRNARVYISVIFTQLSRKWHS